MNLSTGTHGNYLNPFNLPEWSGEVVVAGTYGAPGAGKDQIVIRNARGYEMAVPAAHFEAAADEHADDNDCAVSTVDTQEIGAWVMRPRVEVAYLEVGSTVGHADTGSVRVIYSVDPPILRYELGGELREMIELDADSTELYGDWAGASSCASAQGKVTEK